MFVVVGLVELEVVMMVWGGREDAMRDWHGSMKKETKKLNEDSLTKLRYLLVFLIYHSAEKEIQYLLCLELV